MRIAIVADTHDNMHKIAAVVELCTASNVGMLLHAGDFCSPFTLWEFKKLHCKLVAVFGNNDGERVGLLEKINEIGAEVYPVRYEGLIGSRKVFMTHYPSIAVPVAQSGHYDLVICGHSHKVQMDQFGSSLLVNPGEAGGWVTGKATMILLETDTMDLEVVDL